jgi:hypothetical protein
MLFITFKEVNVTNFHQIILFYFKCQSYFCCIRTWWTYLLHITDYKIRFFSLSKLDIWYFVVLWILDILLFFVRRGTNFENINFDSHEILASTTFWGLWVTNIDTQKRLTSTPLKLGINIKIKVVTNINRDCSPSRTLSGYPVPPTL